MVEPDQDVNPITKYVQRQFAGKLVRTDCKAYGTAAIILTLSILVFCWNFVCTYFLGKIWIFKKKTEGTIFWKLYLYRLNRIFNTFLSGWGVYLDLPLIEHHFVYFVWFGSISV